MPMYFPDLKSVKRVAEMMREHAEAKRYNGIIPQTDSELPEARKQLAKYFRDVWGDEIQAMEIEEAVTKDDYRAKLGAAIERKMKSEGFYV